MMEVGKVYENRNGHYKVRDIFYGRGVAVIEYVEGNGVASGAVDVLLRVHENIQNERKPRVEKPSKHRTSQPGELSALQLILADRLLEQGCEIRYVGHDDCTDGFISQYLRVTGIQLQGNEQYVSSRPDGWKAYGFNIYVPKAVEIPEGVKSYKHAKKGTARAVTGKALGWYLMESGFRLGPNKGSQK